ncbi:HupE/UreJ family protein [Phyllobacterium sp. UNC302MFCol5.2]|uniref:HupE/UreJ family protein n=1 Tax=Phyllobacterium sp. UNC302MFCol5.2 TaxID=1449065 RepID=UPI000485C3A7|nr:HupE/UreJ family protein [Phyllobacterium sp. UNC302MFCol5.2]
MPALRTFKIAVALAASLLPSLAHAHVGLGDTGGFTHGFAHPLTGLDHILAMVLVGILAVQMGGRALWLLPLAFIGMMSAGAALGFAGLGMPFVEVGIAASVIVLGAAVAFEVRTPVAVAVALAGLFATFHGHAHGAEMPMNVAGYAYGAGFIAATAILHLAGITLGLGAAKFGERFGPNLVRIVGAIAAAAGLGILGGAI